MTNPYKEHFVGYCPDMTILHDTCHQISPMLYIIKLNEHTYINHYYDYT